MGVQKKMVKTPPDKTKKSAVKGVKLAKKASPEMKGAKKVTSLPSGKPRGGSGGGGTVPPLPAPPAPPPPSVTSTSSSSSNLGGAEMASAGGLGSGVNRGTAGGAKKHLQDKKEGRKSASFSSSSVSPSKSKTNLKKSVGADRSAASVSGNAGKSVKKGRKSPVNPSGSGLKSPGKTKKGVSIAATKKTVKSVSSSSGGKKTTPAKSPKTKSASITKKKSSPKAPIAPIAKRSPGKGAKKVGTSKKVASGGKSTVEVPSHNEDEVNESEEEIVSTSKRKVPAKKKKQIGTGSKRGQSKKMKKKGKLSVAEKKSGKGKESDGIDSNSSSGDEALSTDDEEEENEGLKSIRKPRVSTVPKKKTPIKLSARPPKVTKKGASGRKQNDKGDIPDVPSSEDDDEKQEEDGIDEEENVRSRTSRRQTPKKNRAPQVKTKVTRTPKKIPVKRQVNDPSSEEDQSSSTSEDENSKAKNGKPKGNKNSSQVSASKMGKFQKRSPPKGRKPVSSSDEDADSSEDDVDKGNQKKGNKGRAKMIAKKTANSRASAKLKSTTMMKKKTASKALMAKKKLKQMQSLGFWGAPPRRAASLNATAVMHCMYDQDLPPSKTGSLASPKNALKLKKNDASTPKDRKDLKKSKPQPRRSATAKMREAKEGDEDVDEEEQDADEEEEEEVDEGPTQNHSDADEMKKTKNTKKADAPKSRKGASSKSKIVLKKQMTNSESDDDDDDDDNDEVEENDKEDEKAKGVVKTTLEKKSRVAKAKSKPPTSAKKKQTQPKNLKRRRASSEEDGNDDRASDGSATDTDDARKKEATLSLKQQKKKKSLKDEFKMDIRDMIVKKRIASLNASAIMSASYSQLKSPPLSPIKALALKTDEPKPIVELSPTHRGSKKIGPKQSVHAPKTGKKSATIPITASSCIMQKKRKISSATPDEQQPIIFEIEDERIKSLLIASAMKKAGNSSGLLGKDEKTHKLPPKKRKLEKCALTPISGSGAQKKKLQSGFLKYDESPKGKKRKKKRKKNINVDMSSSSSSSEDESASNVTSGESDIENKQIEVVDDDDDDDEIETIFTEGARSEGIVSRLPGAAHAVLPSAENPMALKTEMNKVDVQIMDSGRVIHHHQVVHHRFETISTTTSMVPRSGSRGNQSVQQDDGSTVPGNGKYTPLGALASLQPGNGHPTPTPSQGGVTPGPPAPAPRFPSTYQGFYQPAGPLIRPGSPANNVVPPTATVQPTVVSCAASGSGGNHRPSGGHPGSGLSRESEFSSSQKNIPSTSPVKPTPQQASAPLPPATMAAPPYPPTYPYPYPTEYLPPGYAAPPPSHIPYHQGTAQLPGGPPPPPPQAPLHYAPYHPAEFRHPSYPMYHHANPAATAPGYPPQGPYYLAPALPYHPSALSSTTSPSSSTSGTQVALSAPHPAGTAFYYGGYSAAAYPYTAAGRIVTPILALAPPGHQPPPPHSMVPPGFPTQHHQAQTSIYSYSVQHDPKNVQAGSQPVGKGLNSQPPPPPTFATTPTTATSIVVSTGVSTKSVCSANSKKAPKSVNSSSKDLRPTLKVPTPKSHGALPSQVVPNEVYRTILPRQPLPPKGPPGYSKSKSSRARSPPEVAVVAASKAKVSNVKACNPPNPVQPFVVGQTTIHPVDPNAIRKPHKPVVVESQMATITPKMMPIVSTAASRTSSSTGKSSLRDYRKPAKSKHQLSSPATMATITHSQSSPNSSSGLKCIPSVIVPNPPSEKRAINPPSTAIYQHLPKGLTITEIDRSRSLSSKSSVKGSKITTVPSNSETLTATTSQNPSATSASSVFSTSSSSTASLMTAPHSNGHRFHLMPVINIPDPHKNRRPPPPTSTGHPGLPNGLLRMAHTSLQQQSQPPPPKIATKVVPKDLKSQLALSKIALSMASGTTSQDGGSQGGYQASNSCSTSTSSTSVSKNGQPPPPPSISVSMAKSAAMALHPHQHPIPKLLPKKSKSTLLKTRKVNNNKPTLLLNGGRSTSSLKSTSRLCGVGTASPGSSRSSSRNSSLSPRERSGSSSKGGSATVPFLGVGGGKSVMSSGSSSGSNNSSGGGSGKVPLSPLSRGSSSINKKKVAINQFQGPLIPWSKRHNGVLKSCNGWQWVGEGSEQKVYLNNEEPPVPRICYDSMKHCTEGDVVKIRDCILLASGNRKKDLPFIAKVTALWENPTDGDMMMSLLWYYRPEHLESGRRSDDMSDEVYASRHRDNTSVACIEDKCYVMTFNEYCRYRKFLRMVDQGLSCGTSIVPDPLPGYERAEFLPTQRVAPDRVFLCRRVYESRQRRLLKNPY